MFIAGYINLLAFPFRLINRQSRNIRDLHDESNNKSKASYNCTWCVAKLKSLGLTINSILLYLMTCLHLFQPTH